MPNWHMKSANWNERGKAGPPFFAKTTLLGRTNLSVF